ncbi:non-heme iron oxygenase ferredoxin subunit [Flexivirga sp. ID2601S]|uniref:Non-heme iron oxygenase ferredoxin subunit n=1 Tax=Flexivirga aerilata TaxID=1656889 RepID=A0A849ANL6_9MICO|nr:non-heme iron oxygenase ferredoxin subunit [Flexivirga aerilata]NNG41096.1 non-heme iron oxygenase ferredoxin subunit [Flexivirga aerilata]
MSESTQLTDDFVRVCAVEELPVETAALAEINGVPVAMVRDDKGVVHAVNDICSHGQVSLAEGDVEGCTIECWLHGSRFNLDTGEPTGLPATQPIAVYPVIVQDGDVYVSVSAS